MRIIKFRGKRVDNNEWIYGDLLQPVKICGGYEISDENTIDGSRYEVNPETIGQYTGLRDENGKEIYEGDIVKVKHNNCIYIGKIKYNEEYCEYRIELFDSYVNLWKKLDIEVIGNIYDNPELLEVENES